MVDSGYVNFNENSSFSIDDQIYYLFLRNTSPNQSDRSLSIINTYRDNRELIILNDNDCNSIVPIYEYKFIYISNAKLYYYSVFLYFLAFVFSYWLIVLETQDIRIPDFKLITWYNSYNYWILV